MPTDTGSTADSTPAAAGKALNQNGAAGYGTGPSPVLDFLRQFHGADAPWQLLAIQGENIKAATFSAAPKRETSVIDWVKRWNEAEKHDLYFAINPLNKTVNKKATKNDVATAAYLWIDLDPSKGADPADEQAALDRALDGARPPEIPVPTWEIDSGRGRWGFWRLRETVPLDGEGGAATRRVEGHGRGIEQAFKALADNCRNIERIARLPGTINHKTGRRARVTAYRPEAVYDLQDFPFVDAGDADQPSKGNGKGNDYDFDALPTVDIDGLPISDRIRVMIRTGEDTEEPTVPYGDRRSERAFTVLIGLAAAGCDDMTMAAIMLDTALPIGAHVRDQRESRKYLVRQIGRARDRAAADPAVADTDGLLNEMNEKYSVVLDGARVRVLTFERHVRQIGRYEHIRRIPTFLSFEDFRNFHLNRLVKAGAKPMSLGHWWLKHPQRHQYAGLTFQPGGPRSSATSLIYGAGGESPPRKAIGRS
jgi:hypothetical protein